MQYQKAFTLVFLIGSLVSCSAGIGTKTSPRTFVSKDPVKSRQKGENPENKSGGKTGGKTSDASKDCKNKDGCDSLEKNPMHANDHKLDPVLLDNLVNPDKEMSCTAEEAQKPHLKRRLRLLSPLEYENTIADIVGNRDLFSASAYPPVTRVHGFSNNYNELFVSPNHAKTFNDTAKLIAESLMENTKFFSCDLKKEDAACTKKAISTLVKRAWRKGESSSLTGKIDKALKDGLEIFGADREKAVLYMLTYVFSSPHFLYRFEIGSKQGDAFQLDSYEMASALSYHLWQSPPNSELLALAEKDSLKSEEQIVAQAKKMMESKKADASLAEFVASWLGSDKVVSVAKTDSLFPEFDLPLRRALDLETKTFFIESVRSGKPFSELYSAEYTYGDDKVAKFYNSNVTNMGNKKVIKLGSERKGILGHGAVLASHSTSEESGPIHRGIFVLEQVYCKAILPTPAGVIVKNPAPDENATTRERFSEHRANPACASCHDAIDGAGFGLERYDAIGKYRDKENGLDVDSTGELLLSKKGAPFKYDGLLELSDHAAKSEQAKRCFVVQMFRYATGGQEGKSDTCQIRGLYDHFEDHKFTLDSVFVGAVTNGAFRVRTE